MEIFYPFGIQTGFYVCMLLLSLCSSHFKSIIQKGSDRERESESQTIYRFFFLSCSMWSWFHYTQSEREKMKHTKSERNKWIMDEQIKYACFSVQSLYYTQKDTQPHLSHTTCYAVHTMKNSNWTANGRGDDDDIGGSGVCVCVNAFESSNCRRF